MTIRFRRAPTSYRIERVPPSGSEPATGAGDAGHASLEAEVEGLRRQGVQTAETAEALRRRLNAFSRSVRYDAAVRRRLFPKSEPAPVAAPHGVTGEAQRAARERAGLSQRALGEQLTLSRSQLAEAERGRRPVHPRAADWVKRSGAVTEGGTDGS